jgi:hypothetical protein
LTLQIRKRGDRRVEVGLDFTRVGENVIIGSTHWLGEDGRRQERYQVLTIRHGKIVDMQGCATRRHAERFARRTGARSERAVVGKS